MGKAKMLGQNKPYIPNSRAATPGRKKPNKNRSATPKIITSMRILEVSLVPDAEPCCRINREKEK